MARFANIAGQKFGRLTAVKWTGQIKKHQCVWSCLCECGAICAVRIGRLRSGHTKSCGCLQRDLASKWAKTGLPGRTHGLSKSKMMGVLRAMLRRCHSPKSKEFKWYGARGIAVCDRWRFGENGSAGIHLFVLDMGPKPFPRAEVDRIDNNGNYEPGNCRWATRKTQLANTRRNRRITFDGIGRTVAEWCDHTHIKRGTLMHRLNKGWSVKDALTKPVDKRQSRSGAQ